MSYLSGNVGQFIKNKETQYHISRTLTEERIFIRFCSGPEKVKSFPKFAEHFKILDKIWRKIEITDNLVSRNESVCQLLMKKMEMLIKWMERVKKYENRGAAIFTA